MSEIDRRPLSKVKNTAGYCLQWINLTQTWAKIDGILSGHGGKLGTYYPDLNFRTGSRFSVPATNY